jgi:hypothetical protein
MGSDVKNLSHMLIVKARIIRPASVSGGGHRASGVRGEDDGRRAQSSSVGEGQGRPPSVRRRGRGWWMCDGWSCGGRATQWRRRVRGRRAADSGLAKNGGGGGARVTTSEHGKEKGEEKARAWLHKSDKNVGHACPTHLTLYEFRPAPGRCS